MSQVLEYQLQLGFLISKNPTEVGTLTPGRESNCISMHDVLIIGAGPAGLSAARWCDELGLDTLVLEQNEEVGGQLLSVYNRIENYLGVRAANGRELRDLFAEQTKDCDFDLWRNVEIQSLDLKAKTVALRSGEKLQAIAIVVAT